MSDKFQTKNAVTLGGAHFVNDIYTAFIAPLLPLLIAKHSLSLTLAGTLSIFLNLATFATPVLGAFLDRHGMTRRIAVLTPALTAIAVCLVGSAPNYWTVVVFLMLGSVSIAAWHVTGPVLMARVSGNRLGRGMSFYMVGGEVARAVGPMVAVQAVAFFTLEGIWRVAFFAVMYSVFLGFWLKKIPSPPTSRATEAGANVFGNLSRTVRKMGRFLGVVLALMIARAFMNSVCTHYLPTFLHFEGLSLFHANLALTLLEVGGVVGAMTSGTVSDWLGRRGVLLAVMSIAPPLMLLFLVVPQAVGMVLLVIIGFVALAAPPVLLALVIEQAKTDRATANGTFIMMSFGVRSLVLLLVGVLGDQFGLRTTFAICACIGFLGIPFVLKLPKY